MNSPITKHQSGDFTVNTLKEFDRELKKLREKIEFPMLKGKNNDN